MNADDYIVGGVTVTGVRFLDANALIGISGIRIGQEITIPGDAVTTAVQKLWQQGLFSDVRISVSKIILDSVFLDIYLQERPRISTLNINGVKKSEKEDILKKINLPIGSQITAYLLNTTNKIIRNTSLKRVFSIQKSILFRRTTLTSQIILF